MAKTLLVLSLAAVAVWGQNLTVSPQERDYARVNAQAEAKGLGTIAPVPARELRMRGGLPNFLGKLERGEAATVAYFGGSITAHNGWRVMTFDWLRQRYPQARLEMLNASLGGTGSLVGAFRADAELVAFRPDMVFIEFALNDGADAAAQPREVLRALEGIVRKIWRAKPDTDICLVYTVGAGDVKTLAGGVFQRGASVHEMIAEHYGLPSIHLGLEIARLEQAGKLIAVAPEGKDGKTADGKLIFTNDGTHPTIPWGHAIYAGVMERSLEQLRGQGQRGVHALGKPLQEDHWELAKTIPLAGNARFEGAWDQLTAANGPSCMRYGKRFYEWFPHLYRTTTPGASFTVRFRGSRIGIKGIPGPDAGVIGTEVDGGPVVKENLFTVYSTRHAYGGRPLPGVDQEGEHTVRWTLLPDRVDKGRILASYYRKGNDQDYLDHPEKYAENAFYAGQILLVGDVLPPEDGTAAIYVSPQGNDANPGTEERPVKTLERARDAARAGKANEVILEGGLYRRERELRLTAADSQVRWHARSGAAVVWSTAVPVPATAARLVTAGPIWERLDPAARGKVVELDAVALGLRHTGPYPDTFADAGGLFEIFENGERLPISRWPNRGYTRMVRVTDEGDWSKGPSRRGGAFLYEGDRPAKWLRAAGSGLWLDGFWRVPWTPEKVRVASIDLLKKEIRHAAPVNLGIGSKYARPNGDGKEPWYALNVIEEIDQPGEWAFDFQSKKIYVWPRGQLTEGALWIADRSDPVLSIAGATGVRIEGITIEGSLGNGIEIEGGQSNLVAGCELRSLGKTGVMVRGGSGHRVESSDFHQLGHGGVYLTGGDRKTLTPAGHEVLNNHFYRLGEVRRTYAPAVSIAFEGPPAVGMHVANNLIHDLPHAAVLYAGNDHLIERNEVHNVALDSGDVGAFYTTNDWTSRGNILRHNFVHHASAANAFYMDDGDCGDLVTGNVIYKTGYGPFIGGGHDNIVRGNLVIEAKRGLHLDARGIARHYDRTDRHKMDLLGSVDYRQSPWSEKYPLLLQILDKPEYPVGNVLEGNALVDCNEPLHLDKPGKDGTDNLRFSVVRNNIVTSAVEAAFVDAAALDFRLRPESPLRKKLPELGEIPFERIGLYRDRFRQRLPSAAETGRGTDRREAAAFDSEVDRKASDRRP